jgi:hypothetical protein
LVGAAVLVGAWLRWRHTHTPEYRTRALLSEWTEQPGPLEQKLIDWGLRRPREPDDVIRDFKELGPAGVSALGEALSNDERWYVRQQAARALGGIGPAAKDAVPALTDRLKDEHQHVREAAAEALKKIRGKAADDPTRPVEAVRSF